MKKFGVFIEIICENHFFMVYLLKYQKINLKV